MIGKPRMVSLFPNLFNKFMCFSLMEHILQDWHLASPKSEFKVSLAEKKQRYT